MSESPEREPSWQRQDRIIFGGLAGLSYASALQLAAQPSGPDNGALKWAGLLFAVATPLLVVSWLLVGRSSPVRTTPGSLVDVAGVVLAVVGIACIFLQLDPVAGGSFLVACVIAFFSYHARTRT